VAEMQRHIEARAELLHEGEVGVGLGPAQAMMHMDRRQTNAKGVARQPIRAVKQQQHRY
jgi:hypothetical protein